MRDNRFVKELFERYPDLEKCADEIGTALDMLIETYEKGNKLIVCGNGGSAADANHIVGELMKGFLKRRPLPEELREELTAAEGELGSLIAEGLQTPLEAVSLTEHVSLATAFANDENPELGFAQQLLGFGKKGDLLLAVSTSGNARTVEAAVVLAGVLGIRTLGLTGRGGGRIAPLCEVCIRVPEDETFLVQELHVPVYHTLCAAVEEYFFPV
jgi:D-sedoheptulose 7-phosphate isomerase